jgi:hypothetical protein
MRSLLVRGFSVNLDCTDRVSPCREQYPEAIVPVEVSPLADPIELRPFRLEVREER